MGVESYVESRLLLLGVLLLNFIEVSPGSEERGWCLRTEEVKAQRHRCGQLRAARPEGEKGEKKLGETQRCSYSSARMTSRDDPCVTEHFIIGSAKLIWGERGSNSRPQDHSNSYETYALANCATTPLRYLCR